MSDVDVESVLTAAAAVVTAFGTHKRAEYFDCFASDATFVFTTLIGFYEPAPSTKPNGPVGRLTVSKFLDVSQMMAWFKCLATRQCLTIGSQRNCRVKETV
jgi:hypothetical protein